jgi:MerR family transcriptional regulator, redox-sensitive transcriptional activator SoxR
MLSSWPARSVFKSALRQTPFSRKFCLELDGNLEFDRLSSQMPQLSISEAARKVGLRPSAIRYYEQIGILPPVTRERGQRRYNPTILSQLIVIHQARQNGFRLDEIRELFFGFDPRTKAAARWQKLSEQKLNELEASIEQIRKVQHRLWELRDNCRCKTLEECGERFRQRQKRTRM